MVVVVMVACRLVDKQPPIYLQLVITGGHMEDAKLDPSIFIATWGGKRPLSAAC